MFPVIGITSNFDLENHRSTVSSDYTRAVESAGGIPLLIPVLDNPGRVGALLDRLDGLILTGGVDVDPSHFGEEPRPKLGRVSPERDRIEIPLARAALEKRLPLLGVCRGIQLLNIAAGGAVFQDIYSQVKDPLKHNQEAPRWYPSHEVKLDQAALVGKIHGVKALRVNSFHHQAVSRVAPGFVVSAWAGDGVIEGIERPGDPFTVGVQWHPEGMWEKEPRYLAIFTALVEAARG
ncbi:MAG: gamma-glutamyl-gamma-aminobutyrate hydrolase family protein [Firmicutes bacterium]|nr:gamma-glutamyl-gamma-aminobutyrate hydrolase family protein [Bacillota bacterium]